MPYLGKPPPITTNLLEDADQDTKVQVEESADEDTIRFDIAGAEVATLTDSSLVLKGTTPTLTIGDAGTEDTKIVFDGNAQDFHIGLDDTADDLVIGLGSTLGTTTHMAFDETGAIIKPLQPGFSAIPSAQVNNLAADATHDLAFATEIWDTNADFATPSFTAPVTGKYLFVWTVQVYYIAADADFYEISLVTSNRNYRQQMDPDFGQNNVFWDFHGTAIADMDTSDTAKVTLLQDDGTAMTDYTVLSRFAGYLLG